MALRSSLRHMCPWIARQGLLSPANRFASTTWANQTRLGMRKLTLSGKASATNDMARPERDLAAAVKKEALYEHAHFDAKEESEVIESLEQSGWLVSEKKGERNVALQRQLGDETINIMFGLAEPSLEDSTEPQPVPFTVRIQKDHEECHTVLRMSTLGGELDCTQLAFEDSDREGEVCAYPGPILSELDKDLQQSIIDFLASRGIGETLGEDLEVLYHYKEKKEYTGWLDGLQAFLG